MRGMATNAGGLSDRMRLAHRDVSRDSGKCKVDRRHFAILGFSRDGCTGRPEIMSVDRKESMTDTVIRQGGMLDSLNTAVRASSAQLTGTFTRRTTQEARNLYGGLPSIGRYSQRRHALRGTAGDNYILRLG